MIKLNKIEYLINNGFFSGLLNHLLEIANYSKFNEETREKYCKAFFNSCIEDTESVIESFYDDCVKLLLIKQKAIESEFNDIIHNIATKTKQSIEKVRIEAQIKERNEKKLKIINELKQQLNLLIEL